MKTIFTVDQGNVLGLLLHEIDYDPIHGNKPGFTQVWLFCHVPQPFRTDLTKNIENNVGEIIDVTTPLETRNPRLIGRDHWLKKHRKVVNQKRKTV